MTQMPSTVPAVSTRLLTSVTPKFPSRHASAKLSKTMLVGSPSGFVRRSAGAFSAFDIRTTSGPREKAASATSTP
jgi:hypothetical protein